MDGTVLIADDDRTIRTVLSQAITRAGAQVHATSSLTTLMRWVREGRGDLVITDVMMPDGNGIDMIPGISELRPGLPVIVISAQNTIMTAIRANEAEAWDYLPKPFDLPDLMRRAAQALEENRPRRKPAAPDLVGAGAGRGAKSTAEVAPNLTPSVDADLTANLPPVAPPSKGLPVMAPLPPLFGRSEQMQHIYQQVAQVMNTDLPVLVTGDSGTGKSLIARAVHALGARAQRGQLVFDPVQMSDPETSRNVLEDLRGGTLFVEDVGDFDSAEQTRLNRLIAKIKTMPEDAAPRLVTTSQQDLSALVSMGRFRSDLYYRLNGLEIHVPRLSARSGDIPLLAAGFLEAARDVAAQGPQPSFSREALAMLQSWNWPGNVRELRNLVERLRVTGAGAEITAREVAKALSVETKLAGRPGANPVRPASFASVSGGGAGHGMAGERLRESIDRHLRRYFDLHQGALPPAGLYQRILQELEVPLLEISMEATQGNQARCADLLGINRNTLRKKLTALDIRVTRGRKMM